MRVAQGRPVARRRQRRSASAWRRGINAAGRLHRADAGARAAADRRRRPRAGDRRGARPRQRRAPPRRAAHPLRGRGAGRRARRAPRLRARRRRLAPGRHRHRRLADRRAPPPPGRADRAATATRAPGSGRSIPAFDLLGGLDACAAHLLRHGGHRAAAGCTIARAALDAFRAAFVRARRGGADARGPRRPSSASTPSSAATSSASRWPRSSRRLAPFGIGNPSPSLLVPAARLVDPRPMGEGKHVRFTVEAGGVRARAVAFGTPRAARRRRRRPARRDLHARAQRVERRRRAAPRPAQARCPPPGTIDARRRAASPRRPPGTARAPCRPQALLRLARRRPAVVAGDRRDRRPRPRRHVPARPRPPRWRRRTVRDRRGGGIAGTIAAARRHRRARARRRRRRARRGRASSTGRLGGFALIELGRAGARPGARRALRPPRRARPAAAPATRRRSLAAGASGRDGPSGVGRRLSYASPGMSSTATSRCDPALVGALPRPARRREPLADALGRPPGSRRAAGSSPSSPSSASSTSTTAPSRCPAAPARPTSSARRRSGTPTAATQEGHGDG